MTQRFVFFSVLIFVSCSLQATKTYFLNRSGRPAYIELSGKNDVLPGKKVTGITLHDGESTIIQRHAVHSIKVRNHELEPGIESRINLWDTRLRNYKGNFNISHATFEQTHGGNYLKVDQKMVANNNFRNEFFVITESGHSHFNLTPIKRDLAWLSSSKYKELKKMSDHEWSKLMNDRF